MCDLICDVITSSALSCDTGEVNAFDKIIRENQKQKRKYGNKLHKTPSDRSFRRRIRSLLTRADAREIADIIYRI